MWKHLPAIVRDGVQNGFVREFGCGPFEYAAKEPAYAAAFDGGMSSHSRVQTSWVLDALRGYDFSSLSHLCDVGGGHGHLLCHLLVQYPHLRGTVLERPSLVEDSSARWAERLGVVDRCQYVAGDMFVDVPSADAYIMKMILHDWSDEECIQVLQVINHRAVPGARMFVAEHVISGVATSHFAELFDLHMMCWGTGRERTTEEYAYLLEAAGWTFAASWFPETGAMAVIEGARR